MPAEMKTPEVRTSLSFSCRSGSEISVNERVVACAKGVVRFRIHVAE
jgi:hypothetical protein